MYKKMFPTLSRGDALFVQLRSVTRPKTKQNEALLRRPGVSVGVFHRRRRRRRRLFFLQLRRDSRAAFLRAVSRVVTFLAARAALGVLRLRAVSGKVTFLAAVSALVTGFRLSDFFLVRSRVRLGAISRPVTGLAAAVADVLWASRAFFARLSRTSATSATSAASAAAAVLRARSRVVTESAADATRVIASAAGEPASEPASIRRSAKPRHVAKPAASVAPNIVHRRRSRIRQRAIPRPVAVVAASVALIVGGRPSGVAAGVVVPSRAASVVIRTVARPIIVRSTAFPK